MINHLALQVPNQRESVLVLYHGNSESYNTLVSHNIVTVVLGVVQVLYKTMLQKFGLLLCKNQLYIR